MTRIAVLAGFGYSAVDRDIVWTDITEWVDMVAGIATTRGASDELQQTQTGTCTLRLDNRDGRFTPGRPGPYFPYVRKRTPIKAVETVLDGVNYCTNPEFEESVDGWEPGAVAPSSYGTDGTHAHSGTQSCVIEWRGTDNGGSLQTTAYGLTLGEVHTASAYVYVPAGSPAVRLVEVDGGTLGALSTLTDTWERVSVSWTTAAGSHTVAVTTGTTSPAPATACWLDDVQIEEAPAPTAYQAGRPATVHGVFYGPATGWLTTWQGLLGTTALTVADLLGWLARSPLQAMLVEEVLHPDPHILLDVDPDLYYPLSEAAGSTSAGEISGTGRPALAPVQAGAGGALTFGQGTGPPADGLGCPVFAPASSTAGIYLACDIGRPLTDSDRPGNHYIELWFSTGVKGRVALHLATSDPAAFETSIRIGLDGTTGALRIDTKVGGFAGSATPATGNLADGGVHHVLYDEAGGMVYVDTVGYAVTVDPMIGLRRVRVGGYGGTQLWDGTIAHVAVYTPVFHNFLDTDQLLSHYATGTTGNAGEDADDRVSRIAQYAGVLDVIAVGDFSPVAGQGELAATALAALRDVERTEGGRLVCARASAALIIQARTVRYNPVAVTTIAWADTETGQGGWADDDQKLTNTVAASRPGGAVQRVTDPDSVAAYGPYQPADLTLLKQTDDEVLDAVTWTVSRYADPPPELRELVVEVSTLPLAQRRALLDADVSTVITVTDLPPEALAAEATITIEGYTATITEHQHIINFHTSRAYTDAVWVLDDSTYSVLGTTTRLAY